ncbi:uncharacterized protein BP01DRAFT_288491 [Aspergillus saccharolyticus JOP 1030-1]|uniref:Fatty acyl-CoA reductase n=1 Tax=Aspergillus saccharolyticus JOP 1030-1 TaxID=1450539 RepID=A0A318ZMK7_9EURO|nr:hypothetical protein BP01DRAFT_288491 [Aspergillus saccharolyticus JOP 1030-1]PYH48829.1 hypothetical protein BP01DRAFT_288491 [Aspergillus saccharolyticus JOP 1030-1]
MTEASYREWFAKQTVLLTGATGGLGGCLLYKLILQVPVKKVFLLHRGLREDAIGKLRRNMPGCVSELFEGDRLELLKGDIIAPNLGLDASQLSVIRKETTVVLNAAANTSFVANAYESCKNNCLPALDLAELALSFPQLVKFVQVSSVFANSFLPDGVVTETLHPFGENDLDCVREVEEILSLKGNSPRTKHWLWPYAEAKYLMERLLVQRYESRLPLLIIRPSSIGPALRDPYPLFCPPGSSPVENFFELYLATGGANRVWRAAKNSSSGSHIVDEIPVDLVSNICLLHLAQGSQGIVQAAAQLYCYLTMDDFIALASPHIPPDLSLPMPCFKWDVDESLEPCFLASLFGLRGRDWRFNCDRSRNLKTVNGPLSLSFDGHDIGAYFKKRVEKYIPITRETKRKLEAGRRRKSRL